MGLLKTAEADLEAIATKLKSALWPELEAKLEAGFDDLLPVIEAIVANRATQIVAALLTKIAPGGLEGSVAMAAAAGLINSLTSVPLPAITPVVIPGPSSTFVDDTAKTAEKVTAKKATS